MDVTGIESKRSDKRRPNGRSAGLVALLGAIFLLVLVSTALAAQRPANEQESSTGKQTFDSAPVGPGTGTRIPGHYIVVLKDSVDHPGYLAETQTRQRNGELGFVYRYGLKGYSAELSRPAVEALRNDPRVKYITPDRRIETFSQTIPNGIKRIGATENAVAAIDGQDTNRVDADVAVIDTGIDYTHPDLNVVGRVNCVPASENWTTEECVEGSGTDGDGHGTHVAGTVGALDNGIGVVGVAPGVRLWAVRTLNNEGEGSESWIVAGIDWVTAHANQIEVANMSLGCRCVMPAVESAIDASVEAGVIYTVAAGNSHHEATDESPARNPNAITVAALADYDGKPGGEAEPLINGGPEICQKVDKIFNYGDDDTFAWFSNYGAVVDVAAPGVCVLSTWAGGGYQYLSGTSMASPHVAGVAAILASKNNPSDKKGVEAIRQQIIDEGSQNWLEVVSASYSDGEHFEMTWNLNQKPLVDLRPQGPATYTTRAQQVSLTTARLNGGVNPNGVETTYRFEYGPTTAYGQSVPASPKSTGAGSSDLRMNEEVSGLKPLTTYHFRLASTNSQSKVTTYGADKTFTTLPAVITRPATATDAHRARLEATINPIGQNTSYVFEYGQSAEYGQSIPVSPAAIGSGTADVMVNQLVTGLKALTTYHFRVTAINGEGSHPGGDRTFTTTGSAFTGGVPTTYIDGDSVGTQEFITYHKYYKGTPLHCEDAPVTGSEPIGETAESLTLTASFTNCTSEYIEGLSLTMNGCRLEFHPGGEEWGEQRGTMDIGPPGCGPITLNLGGCILSIPSQGMQRLPFEQAFGYASYRPEGSGDFQQLRIEVRNTALEYNLSGSLCGRYGTFTNGTFAGEWLLSGRDASGMIKAVGVTNDFAFKATTKAPTSVGATKATLNATVNPNLHPTTYQFEYGKTDSYGTKVPVSAKSAGSGGKSVLVSEALEGLSPRTTYHYRVVATSSEGTIYGQDESFSTWGEWSAQTVPNPAYTPPPTEGKLEDISCVSASMCFAVGENRQKGTAFAEIWNGTSWSVPAGYSEGFDSGSRYGVACTSATACKVVGADSVGHAIAETWTESSGTWTRAIQSVATPSGASNVVLRDVSCSSASACTAVGSYLKEGLTRTLAVRSTGGAWSLQTTPTLEAESGELNGVSCDSGTSCRAVGKRGASVYALAWNGTSWSTATIPNPNESGEAELQKISCSSATWCIAVGSSKTSMGNRSVLAERWNGTAWAVLGISVPGEALASYLQDVSCQSSTACTAVGRYVTKLEGSTPVDEQTLIESLGSSGWTVQSSANPLAKRLPRLSGVSCPSTVCKAVGWARKSTTEAETVTLEESRSGSSWSITTTPNPTTFPTPAPDATLQDVSCFSASMCLAVGGNKVKGKAFAELWNGSEWQLPPNGFGVGDMSEGFADGSRYGVACPTSGSCWVVGKTASGAPVIERWTNIGQGFWARSIQSTPALEGATEAVLSDISCSSASACTAVGSYKNGGEDKPLAERWNGSSWSIQGFPKGLLGAAKLLGVSCDSATSCKAVGSEGSNIVSILWEEGGWFLYEGEIPTPPAATEAALQRIACFSASNCMAVGTYKESSGFRKVLAQRWDGKNWLAVPAPTPSGAQGDSVLEGLSCPTATSCTAVGHYPSLTELGGLPVERKTLVERWDGAEWAIQPAPNASGKISALAGISCTSGLACKAVGWTRKSFWEAGSTPFAERYE
ncbi:MAG TPA: S8 family serine peptidase [Solirubrobacterales bacterium]|nr:S8 family serine peptidase [Solirubrobacterales bacterium]